MNRLFILLFLVTGILFSCEKQDPCDVLVSGIYQYPEIPENHNMTNQEITEFWDLPADICSCISTEGLIETCLNYPNLNLIYAGTSPQSGYDQLVKERFRGMRELETRSDRATYLLKKFQTLDPLGYDPNWESVDIGRFGFYIFNIEVIFSQYANIDPLTKNEKIILIETVIILYDKMKSDTKNYSLWEIEFTTTLSGRLMLQNEYVPFVKAYNENSLVWELVTYYGPSSWETVEFVYNLSKEYLIYLKNN